MVFKQKTHKKQLKNKSNHQDLISIDEILEGKTFHNKEMNYSQYIGLNTALREALKFTDSTGYVATMPELIGAKIKAEKNHIFWANWYSTPGEENMRSWIQRGRFLPPPRRAGLHYQAKDGRQYVGPGPELREQLIREATRRGD